MSEATSVAEKEQVREIYIRNPSNPHESDIGVIIVGPDKEKLYYY